MTSNSAHPVFRSFNLRHTWMFVCIVAWVVWFFIIIIIIGICMNQNISRKWMKQNIMNLQDVDTNRYLYQLTSYVRGQSNWITKGRLIRDEWKICTYINIYTCKIHAVLKTGLFYQWTGMDMNIKVFGKKNINRFYFDIIILDWKLVPFN